MEAEDQSTHWPLAFHCKERVYRGNAKVAQRKRKQWGRLRGSKQEFTKRVRVVSGVHTMRGKLPHGFSACEKVLEYAGKEQYVRTRGLLAEVTETNQKWWRWSGEITEKRMGTRCSNKRAKEKESFRNGGLERISHTWPNSLYQLAATATQIWMSAAPLPCSSLVSPTGSQRSQELFV